MTRNSLVCIFLLVAISGCWGNEIGLNVTFDRISGLAKQDPVIFDGNRIGSVQAVQYNQDGSYTVQVSIEKGFSNAATQYSHFKIVQDPWQAEHKAVSIYLSKPGGTLLEDGATVAGDPGEGDFFGQLHKDLEDGFTYFREQLEKFGRDVQQYPESEEYKNLKKSLEDLAAEIQRKEKQTRERIKREWLPKIQRELDELREKLKQSGREQEIEPLEREVERIRKI